MADQGMGADPPIRADTSGGVVRPLYQERAMKCYVVTDSELKSLSLANGLMVVFFSLASALVGFGIDISKDLVLTPDVSAGARAMAEMTRQACFMFAAGFALAGLWAYAWRRSALHLIKKESGDTATAWAWLSTIARLRKDD